MAGAILMASSNVDTASSSTRKRKSYIWTYFSTCDERVANCDLLNSYYTEEPLSEVLV